MKNKKQNPMALKHLYLPFWLSLVAVLTLLNSCTSSQRIVRPLASSSPNPNFSALPSIPTFKISNAVTSADKPNEPINDNNPIAKMNIFFTLKDEKGKENPINAVCNLLPFENQNSKPCSCVFKWQENNRTGTKTIAVQREFATPVELVQASLVRCSLPDVFQFEIPEGTKVELTITRTSTNLSDFIVKKFNFTKKTEGSTGAFTDQAGNVFDNILRYSCFENFRRGLEIKNRRVDAQNQNGAQGQVKFTVASQFCFVKSDGQTSQEGCENLSPPQFSSESYYYNLYFPSSEQRSNQDNNRFKCPIVKETLRGVEEPSIWPKDSSFALSRHPTDEFIVGVEAFSSVATDDPETSRPTSCTLLKKKGNKQAANQDGNGNNENQQPTADSLVKKCLGFALKPNPHGTCPSFVGAHNELIQTFRLRRFVALYPSNFETDGKMRNEPQALDTIYVIDRPVKKPRFANGPEAKFTMLGPKPCPFAFFDHKGVAETQETRDPRYNNQKPSYVATNSLGWSGLDQRGVNVDGIEFPRQDSPNSCAATLPLFNAEAKIWSIGTVHALNPSNSMKRVFVRPIQPWNPHYEEDSEFQACAPLSQPLLDPPLHFAKAPVSGNVSWCAEVYPTQNPNLAIDPQPQNGHVQPFTSHVIKNVRADTVSCRHTALNNIPSRYAPFLNGRSCTEAGQAKQAAARHPAYLIVDKIKKEAPSCNPGGVAGADNQCLFCSHLTCDRTAFSSREQNFTIFPLLAPPANVESALISDQSYDCTITFDDGSGKAGRTTPQEGCCGDAVHVWTGIPSAAGDAKLRNTSAHLEPGTNRTFCKVPNF